MTDPLSGIVNIKQYPMRDKQFQTQCRQTVDANGVLVMSNFLLPDAIDAIRLEGERHQHAAYFTSNQHNVYLAPPDPQFASDHPRNRLITSSKGCITTDQIPINSALKTLYDSAEFRDFLAAVLNENTLHEYADDLSSINLHYASAGQELGWHFDNSSFAITLLIQKPIGGGIFEYVKNARNADAGEMNYATVGAVLDGKETISTLSMDAGALVLFRGRNSLHRVTPTQGDTTRMLVVLAYNAQPDVSLSESARMTFYGRL